MEGQIPSKGALPIAELKRYPYMLTPKIDGIRAAVIDGKLVSKSLKPIPNNYIRSILEKPEYEGLEGELVVGAMNNPDGFKTTTSFVRSHDKVGPFIFLVFDSVKHMDWKASARYCESVDTIHNHSSPHVTYVVATVVHSREHLEAYVQDKIAEGYEGAMARQIDSPYKCGQSTARESYLFKIKPLEDSECVVIGIQEATENTNEEQTNELGRTFRSSHKEGLIGKGCMGALLVKDVYSGAEFSIGTGFNDEQRKEIWVNFSQYEGTIRKYKFQGYGVKDLPRQPVDLGPRELFDMDGEDDE
jgi:DNA ligase-1